jgi:TatA/E family protein of Tat protein translocase
MFGISGEHLLILGIVLLIFGPRRLPELGNTLGKAIRNFKDAISGVEEAKFRRLEEEQQRAHQVAQNQAAQPESAPKTGATSAEPAMAQSTPSGTSGGGTSNDPNNHGTS